MLALCFSLAGLYMFYINKIYLSILFFILAVFTKQSFLAAPIAAFTCLYFKNKKLALKFGSVMSATYYLLFLVINSLTDGNFYLHTITYNYNIFSFYQAIAFMVKFVWTHNFLILIALWYISSNSASKIKEDVFSIYSILAFCFVFTVGKVGASINYYVETIAAFCIIFGLGLKKFSDSKLSLNSNFKKFIWLAMLIQLISFAHLPLMSPSFEDLNSEKLLSEKKFRNMRKYYPKMEVFF